MRDAGAPAEARGGGDRSASRRGAGSALQAAQRSCFNDAVPAPARANGGRRRAALALLALAGGAPAAPGCARAEREPRVLELLSFRQDRQRGVFLNEPLVFHFGAELERTSVTAESVRITGPDGSSARGVFRVHGNRVEFVPDIPRSADLSDGGLLPAARYEAVLSGFPNPDGLRSRDGAPLSACHRLAFETVDPASSGPLFVDDTPERGEPLRLASQVLGPLDPIVVVCGEALDPSSLVSEDFELWQARPESEEGGEIVPVLIPLRAFLEQNTRDGARIALRPTDERGNLRSLAVGEYQLWMAPERAHLRDLGGHGVLPVWLPEPRAGFLTVTEPPDQGVVSTHVEEFLDLRRRSPAVAPGAAGTAHWADGVVTVRFPAAAGDGADGDVSLVGREQRADVRAAELLVPRGETAHLLAPGLVVLRSQGRLAIDGELMRDVEGLQGASRAAGDETYAEWHRFLTGGEELAWTVAGMDFLPGETLSAWLERARERGLAWTVLVAGGDLVVNGVLWTDGPVLLAAGGWIRISGEIRSRPGEAWSAGWESDALQARTRRAELALDPPALDPLARATTWSVVTAPFRPQTAGASGRVRWLPAEVRADERQGAVSVLFLGERRRPDGRVETVGPVESPVLLEDCPEVRIRVDLTLLDGRVTRPWDPPLVDAVQLSWEVADKGPR